VQQVDVDSLQITQTLEVEMVGYLIVEVRQEMDPREEQTLLIQTLTTNLDMVAVVAVALEEQVALQHKVLRLSIW
jgi:hypothetical protein